MIRLQLAVHVVFNDAAVEDDSFRPHTLYRSVERNWPSVPNKGDMVSLGGGDQMVEEVKFVEWLDGKVVIHFHLGSSDESVLKDLGFELPAQ